MGTPVRCAPAQLILSLAALLLAACPGFARAADAPLSLGEAIDRAVRGQPLLDARRAAVDAAVERASAAGELPDPMLLVGVQDLPVNGSDAYDFKRDSDTQLMVGMAQEFPRGDTRALRAERARLDGEAGAAVRDAVERQVRREAGLAWLDVYQADRAVALAQAMAAEAARERVDAGIGYRIGRVDQASVLGAEVALEVLNDRIAQYRQQGAAARQQLARWIGDEALRETASALPPPTPPPAPEALRAALPRHPELVALALDVEAAATELGIAQQGYKPGWRLEARLGLREDRSEMATVMVGLDLPLFTARRQDPAVAAARAGIAGAEAMRADALRRLTADATRAAQEAQSITERLEHYDAVIVPRSEERATAALAAYRAGSGSLAALLDARRGALDVALMRLELAVDGQRRSLELDSYLP